MRTRNKRLSDYGVPRSQHKKIYEKCRNLNETEKGLLTEAALSSCPIGLVEPILKSLIFGTSYDAMSKEVYVPIKADDFYGYRRKTVAKFYFMTKEENNADSKPGKKSDDQP